MNKDSILKNLPNAITISRIFAIPVLFFLIYREDRFSFSWLFFLALLSDIADGLLARILKLQSVWGAKLDSWADLLLFFVGIFGIVRFEPGFLSEFLPWISIILFLYGAEMTYSLVKFSTISSFHTYGSRIAAYSLGILFMSLFWFGVFPPLVYLSFFLCGIAYVEEILILSVLRELETDVRGFYWILKRKNEV